MNTGPALRRLLRIVADDGSAGFGRRAQPGEWAVPGACAFAAEDPAQLPAARAAAFESGFLGLGSQGWSAEVEVVDIDARTLDGLTLRLAAWLREEVGAPDLDTALAVAREELDYALQLAADAAPGSRLRVTRRLRDGDIHEEYRLLGSATQPQTGSGAGSLFDLVGRVRDGR